MDVQWDDGNINSYRYGHDGKFDVEAANDSNSKSVLSLVIINLSRFYFTHYF